MLKDFVKNHFRGAVIGVDMDKFDPYDGYNSTVLVKAQVELAKQRKEVESQSGCACAKLMVTGPYKSKFSLSK